MGGHVLVHCREGKHRTGAFVLVILLLLLPGIDEAHELRAAREFYFGNHPAKHEPDLEPRAILVYQGCSCMP